MEPAAILDALLQHTGFKVGFLHTLMEAATVYAVRVLVVAELHTEAGDDSFRVAIQFIELAHPSVGSASTAEYSLSSLVSSSSVIGEM